MNINGENIDKILHLSISFNIATVVSSVMSPFSSCAVAMLIGLSKEIYDYQDYGGFGWLDLGFDLLGVLLFFLVWRTNKFIKKNNDSFFGESDELFLFLCRKFYFLIKS
jgi:hypothetical protein